jgi:bifunctional DNA-binding transcriptional regulator/antitoxin component of YhaV-PrlF toxin-antitoxin module
MGVYPLDAKIIKIIQIKSNDRISLPKEAREILNVKEKDHIAFFKDEGKGIRVVKIKFEEGRIEAQ